MHVINPPVSRAGRACGRAGLGVAVSLIGLGIFATAGAAPAVPESAGYAEDALHEAERLHEARPLISVELAGRFDQESATGVASALEAEGIETWVRALPGGQGYAVSAGVFRDPANAERMQRRLADLGFDDAQVSGLRHRSVQPEAMVLSDPRPVGAIGGGSEDRVVGAAATSPAPARPPVFDLGAPPVVSSPEPAAAPHGPSVGLDQLRLEAGVLPRSAARADGSHYFRADVSAEWPLDRGWSVQLGARVDASVQTGDDRFESVALDYTENTLRYRDGSRSVTLGTQTVVWGQADEFPPTDQLSVRDISRFALDDLEDRRRAVFAVRWEEFVGDYKLDVLAVPFFRPAELPRESSVWSLVDRSRGRIAGMPEDPMLAPLVRDGGFASDDGGFGGWGVRLSHAGRGVDYALTVQDARQSLPYFTLDSRVRDALMNDPDDIAGALASAPAAFVARHPRTWVVGGGVGFATDLATWRFEAAWFSDRPATAADLRFLTLQALEWAAGADWFPGDGNLRVTLQLNGTHLLDAPQGVLDRVNRLSLFGEIENSFLQDRWRGRVRFLQGLDERETYVHPSLVFLGWAPHEWSIGYHYLGGSDSTPGGFYRANDLFTIGWRVRY